MKNIALLLLIIATSCREKAFDPTNNPNDHSNEPTIMVGFEWAGAKGDYYRLLRKTPFPAHGMVYYFDGSSKDSMPIELNADSLTIVKMEMTDGDVMDTVVFVTKGRGDVYVQQVEDIFSFRMCSSKDGIYCTKGFYRSKKQAYDMIFRRKSIIEQRRNLHEAQNEWDKITESNMLQYY